MLANLGVMFLAIELGAQLIGAIGPGVWAIIEHMPVAHNYNTVTVGCDVELMGHHDQGDARGVQRLEESHDFDAGASIEVAGWFIGER
jgi:hypothetical protein